jgi:hypothetical protein
VQNQKHTLNLALFVCCCGTCACRTVQNRGSLEPRTAPPWLTRCSRRAKETATRKGCACRSPKYPLTSSVRRWFRAWQCSPAENCVVLPQGFLIFALFDFVSGLNFKNKPALSMSDRMPVSNVPIPAGELVGSISAPTMLKESFKTLCPEHRHWRTINFELHGFLLNSARPKKVYAKREAETSSGQRSFVGCV